MKRLEKIQIRLSHHDTFFFSFQQFLAFLARTNVEQIQEIVQCISGACEAQVMKKIKRKIVIEKTFLGVGEAGEFVC